MIRLVLLLSTTFSDPVKAGPYDVHQFYFYLEYYYIKGVQTIQSLGTSKLGPLLCVFIGMHIYANTKHM